MYEVFKEIFGFIIVGVIEEFQEKTGMNLADCIKILVNSVKYGGKLEFDTFWSDENISELKL